MENDVSRTKEPLFFVVRSPGIFQSLTQPAHHELGRGVEHRGDGETSVPHVRSRDRHPERPFVPQRLRTVSRFIRTAFMSVGGEPWYGVLSRLRKKENKKGTSCDIPATYSPANGGFVGAWRPGAVTRFGFPAHLNRKMDSQQRPS